MFIPPHCPNPDCSHYAPPQSPHWFRKKGFYRTKTFGRIPRFRCSACSTSFSRQTFSLDYYAKRLLDYSYIYRQINAGAGIRNIARDLNVREKAITNRINRMARNATLISQAIIKHLPFDEDLVLDGLQNFCVSQYFPDNYTILVGKDSQFVYECDYATLRRSGRMRPDQKKRRAELEKRFTPSRKAVEHSFARLLVQVGRMRKVRLLPLILYTDEKKDYQRVLWNHRENRQRMFSGQWRHHMTSSEVSRNNQNPLFSVNYIDREIRKDMASQSRETVQFPRNVSNAMLRMNLYLYDHNVRKPYRVADREKKRVRHAQVAGLGKSDLEALAEGFFRKRVFRSKDLELSPSARMTLDRRWVTPLKEGEEKVWKYMAA